MAQSEDNPAKSAVGRLEGLFRDVDQLGLGPVETLVCKRKIVSFVRPSDMTENDLVSTVEAQRRVASK